MAGCRGVRQARGHLVAQSPHLGLGVPGVGGKAQFPGGRAHGPRPVADRHRLERRAVQDGQVPRQASDPGFAQRGERLGHRCAHEGEGLPVSGQHGGVGAAPVERGGDAGHEGGVVGKPPVHAGDTLDAESALAQRAFHIGQAGIAAACSAVGCCLMRTYSATPSRMTPPTPGKPSRTSPGMSAGIAERPPGLLPKNSTVGAPVSAVSCAHARASWSLRTAARTRS